MLDTWDWRHHPSIHPLLGSGRRGPFLPPLIRYVDPADFLSRDHCLLSINKRPLFSSDHWISLSERVGEEGSFLGQVTTNTAQKEKEDEKRTVRSWMDGWAMCINGSERARESWRCTNRFRKWRGTRSTTPKTQPPPRFPFRCSGMSDPQT